MDLVTLPSDVIRQTTVHLAPRNIAMVLRTSQMLKSEMESDHVWAHLFDRRTGLDHHLNGDSVGDWKREYRKLSAQLSVSEFGRSELVTALDTFAEFVVSGSGSDVSLWRARSGERAPRRPLWRVSATAGDISGLIFDINGSRVAMTDSNNVVDFDVDTGTVVSSLSLHTNASCISRVPALEDTCIVGLAGGQVAVVDRRTSRIAQLSRPHEGTVLCVKGGVTQHPTVYTAGRDQTVRYLDLRQECSIATQWVGRAVRCLDVSERFLLAGGGYQGRPRLCLWDLDSGIPVGTPLQLLGHAGAVSSCILDGRLGIITSSWDGSFRFWDTETGRSVRCVRRAGVSPPVLQLSRLGQDEFVVATADDLNLWSFGMQETNEGDVEEESDEEEPDHASEQLQQFLDLERANARYFAGMFM